MHNAYDDNSATGSATVMFDSQYKDGRPGGGNLYSYTVAKEGGQWKIADWMMVGG